MAKRRKSLFQLLTVKTTQRQYIEKLTKTLTKYSLNRAIISEKFLINYLGDNTRVINQTEIDFIINRIVQIHTIGLQDIDQEVGKETAKFYKHQKGKAVPVQKSKRKKDEDNYDASFYSLEDYDRNAISSISDGQMIWLKDHASGSTFVKDIEKVLIESNKNKLTGDQTVGVLRTYFSSITPAEYAKRYGEASYWKGFQLNQATLIRNNADLSRFDQAGITKYQIYARLTERTCARCRSFHGKVYTVKSGKARMERYFDAVKNNDLKAMKKVSNWKSGGKPATESELSQSGVMSPFHFRCECYIKYITDEMIADLDNRFNNIKDGNIRRTAKKSFNDDAEINLIVDNVKENITYEYDVTSKKTAYYSPVKKGIFYRDRKVARSERTFRHKFGHAVSDQYSLKSPRMIKLFERYKREYMEQFDPKELPPEEIRLNVAYWNDRLNKELALNSGLQDMISGVTRNRLDVNFFHENSYWNNPGNYDLEEFIANYFEMRGNLDPTNLEQARDVFPEICDYLDQEITKISKQ